MEGFFTKLMEKTTQIRHETAFIYLEFQTQ